MLVDCLLEGKYFTFLSVLRGSSFPRVVHRKKHNCTQVANSFAQHWTKMRLLADWAGHWAYVVKLWRLWRVANTLFFWLSFDYEVFIWRVVTSFGCPLGHFGYPHSRSVLLYYSVCPKKSREQRSNDTVLSQVMSKALFLIRLALLWDVCYFHNVPPLFLREFTVHAHVSLPLYKVYFLKCKSHNAPKLDYCSGVRLGLGE